MYIPIMKNRTIEISVLKELIHTGISEDTIPMIEVIQDRSRSNSAKDYTQEIGDIFKDATNRFLLDIPKTNITGSTADSVKKFITRVNQNKDFAIDQLIACENIPLIIPVLSYNIKDSLDIDILSKDLTKLREHYKNIALRLKPAQYNKIGDSCLSELKKKDIFILDIDNKGHTNPAFKKIYKSINTKKETFGFTSVIVNSNRPPDMYNKNIIDGEPIEEIDNSLLEMYKMNSYKFDGFGDYACITNVLPTSGGSISPAGIYYSIDNNFFVGYRGKTPSLSEFQQHIAPAIYKSEYWGEYSKDHHKNCPGCKKIKLIATGKESGKSQALWKGITMSHYIFAVNELLSKK